MQDLSKIAEIVDEAARTAKAISQFAGEDEMSLDEAYAVQAMSIQRRLERGEHRVGVKMGLTSRQKMEQVGVSEVVWGRLTNAMRIEEGGSLEMSDYVHPRVEPEIAYLMKKPLSGDVTPLEALDAVEAVAPALEIIDSRYENFKFSLSDVVADNSSSSSFVVGPWQAPDTDVSNLGILLKFDGREVQVGSSAAILGNPIRSLVAAARMVARAGECLEPGAIVLAGGATAAAPLAAGVHVCGEFQNIGNVEFQVAG